MDRGWTAPEPLPAERLVIELRDKVGADLGSSSVGASLPSKVQPSAVSDAVAALIALGNKAVDADKSVRAAVLKLGSGATADQLVKAALGR